MLKKIFLTLLLVGTLLNATPPSEATVTRLYIATFDRAPDSAGLSYWLNDSGLDLEGIATSFFDQEETQAKYPSGFSHADFIQAIYKNLFKRDPDSDGFEYWHGELEGAKVGRSIFILAIINGALGDDADILANKLTVGLKFVQSGRDDIEEAKEIMLSITADTSTVNPTLCKHTLSGCYTAPIVEEEVVEEEEEEEETTTSTSGGSSGGSSGGGTVILPTNTAPTADAGDDQSCALLNTATPLDGSASSDSDTGDTLTYAWSVTDSPTGSTATLTGETTATPSLTFDTEGSYTLSLIVSDGTDDSTADTVTVQTGGMRGTIDGYGLVCSPHTGKVWLDRNLGATMVCSGSRVDFENDTAYIVSQEDCFGDYYQWGRDADGHEKSTSSSAGTIVDDENDLENAGDEFIKNINSPYDWASVDSDGSIRKGNWSATDGSSVCPIGYRVPTEAELTAETTGADVTNRDIEFSSFLKLPSAGLRYGLAGSMHYVGSRVCLWSASVVGSGSRLLYFEFGDAVWVNGGRAYGQAVRCLRD